MAKGASGQEVKAAFEKHLAETETQVERLDQVFELIGEAAKGKKCPAIDGIIEEGSEILTEYKGAPACDAGLVGAAQAVEHYEIARYGTLITWAEQLGHTNAAELLKATLAEEEATDEALSALGEGGVNQRAVSDGCHDSLHPEQAGCRPAPSCTAASTKVKSRTPAGDPGTTYAGGIPVYDIASRTSSAVAVSTCWL